MSKEIFVSTDVETDGPIPGEFSMLSFASVALSQTGEIIDCFSSNLIELKGARQSFATMEWWRTQPEAWERCRTNPEPSEVELPRYAKWLEGLPGKPVFVGYPATFDFMFVYWYLMSFAGRSPFGFSAIDIKSYAMALLGNDSFRQTSKKTMPTRWFSSTEHNHVALDDALEQGELFLSMYQERSKSVLMIKPEAE